MFLIYATTRCTVYNYFLNDCLGIRRKTNLEPDLLYNFFKTQFIKTSPCIPWWRVQEVFDFYLALPLYAVDGKCKSEVYPRTSLKDPEGE
jgi:hypothetical protein